MINQHSLAAILLMLTGNASYAQKKWTLQECLDYAIANNIQIQQKKLAAASSHEDVLQSRSALFPSVSFSTNQNISWRPFAESTINLTNGSMTTSRNTVSYNGSYGINASWTVWNGNRNTNTIKRNKLSEQAADLDVASQSNTIQEQIAQLYVQTLYENEAVKVCKEVIKASELQRDRAKVMVELGSLAQVDLTQLESQVAQDYYSLSQAESQLANYKLQLKQLLEIHDSEPFEIAIPDIEDSKVLGTLPDEQAVYTAALTTRPEIQSAALDIESSKIALASARSGYMPTISINAGIGTNNSSGPDTPLFTQVKNNLSNSIGLSISVPIFDNLQTRTNIRKAKYTLHTSELNLQSQQKQLYSSVENYWLNASTSQQQYQYAKKYAESMKESYDLVSEQFNLGLKNIVELTTGKNNMLQAEQQLLQTKYTALLNQAMLRFYSGEEMAL